jgi:hypothetical protein
MATIDEFENRHEGSTIWVFGSGATLEFLDPSFFDDKICISTNLVNEHFPLKSFYLFSHYHPAVKRQLDNPGLLMAFTHDLCSTRWSGTLHYGEGEWCFGNLAPSNVVVNKLSWTQPPGSGFEPYRHAKRGELVFGSSSIHGSIQLAAHMGAKNIVLVGVDCGTIDGVNRIDGYPAGHTPWQLYNNHLIAMKKWIGETYGANVYSLNPFVNFNLEGHTFQGVQ